MHNKNHNKKTHVLSDFRKNNKFEAAQVLLGIKRSESAMHSYNRC